MISYVVLIPARLASTRLPNKPLIDIAGKSLIERTWCQVTKVVPGNKVFVLTDSELIVEHCRDKGIQVVLTSNSCLTGTDRVAEFARAHEYDYYINVQGDEPLMNPDDIQLVINQIMASAIQEIVCGYAKIENESDFRSLTIPKVVFRPDGRLLYMSRSGIPGNKLGQFSWGFKQVCVYAFPRKPLLEFSKVSKTRLEEAEDIEILRFLELGYDVKMIQLSTDSIAVDVPEDVIKVVRKLKLEKKIYD